VDFQGVLTGDQGQSYHRVLVDPNQATGLADPTAFLQMLEYREGFRVREFTTVQRRAFAFRKAFLTGAAGEHPAFFVRAIAEANAEVVQPATAIVRALGILAAEGFQVVHGGSSRSQAMGKVAKQLESAYKTAGNSTRIMGHDRI
jgi:hypothetical protein